MRYKHFKNADIDVSELAIGTWGLDSNRWSTTSNREEAIEAIRMMVDHGVNLIDTAANYGNGAAEQIVGEAIKTLDRSKILISTKFGVPNDFYKRNVRGVYRDAKFGSVLRELASSLRNLQTDYVDFYFLHWPDPSTPIAETMCALHFAKEQSAIRYIGLSNVDIPLIEEAMKHGKVDVVQPPFSMLDQRYKELMEWCTAHGIDTMTYGSIGGGILSGRYREIPNWTENDVRFTFYKGFKEPVFSKVMELMKTLDEIAEAHQAPVSQVAINWTCQKDYVSTSLVGVTSTKHVKENTDTFNWKLTDEEMKRIDSELTRLGLDSL